MKQNLLFNRASAFGMRFIMVLTMLLIVGVGQAWGAEDSYSCTNTSGSTSPITGTSTSGCFTVKFEKNNASSWRSAAEQHWRLYSGSKVTITPESGITISQIVITTTSNDYATAGKNATWTNAIATASGSTITVTPTDGNQSVTCVPSAQTRWTKITITYESTTPKQEYTLSYQAGETNGTLQVEEGANLLDALSELGTPTSCDATSTTFVGWTATEITEKTNTAPILITSSDVMPSADFAVFAVFAENSGGASFDGTTGGNFKIYAIVKGTKYYAKGTGSKISSTTEESDATEYTFAKTSTGFTIKTGTNYITYSSSTNLGTSTTAYNWDISEGTNGSWRIASVASTARGIVFRAGSSYNQYGGYALSNVSAGSTEYFDVEIGSSPSYSNFITSCTTKTTVTLNPNGGAISDDKWRLEDGVYKLTTEDESITLPTITRTGYTFGGWATPSGGSYDANDIIPLDGTPVTLDAIWTANTYNITYRDQGNVDFSGTHETGYPTQHTYGTETTLKGATKTGYTFDGWYKEAACTNIVTTLGATEYTGNITLYAKWTEKALTRYRTDCDACIPLNGYAEINGTYHFFPGETITMTVTPPAVAVTYTYQWQKFVVDKWEDINGETNVTYTKDKATIEDVGHYRCVVSAEGYCDVIAEYNVKCLQLNVYYDDLSLAFTTPLEKVDATTAAISVDLQNANYKYYFEITDGCENFYGFNGDIHSGWYENVELNAMNSSTHCGLQTTKFGTYIFTVDHSYLTDDSKSYPVVTVTYPASLQEAGKVIYLDNHVLNWTHSNNADGKNKIYYRIGRDDHNNKIAMALVPGTAALYKVTTTKYDNFDVWHIANNGCWSDYNSIYKTKTGDEWAATQATAFETVPVTLPIITVTPTTVRSVGGEDRNNNCEFYNYDITEGLKKHKATVRPAIGGTITVSYTDHDGTAKSDFTSGDRDLAHTCLLTITATPDAGYSGALTVNGEPFTSGNVHTLAEDAVIAVVWTEKAVPDFAWSDATCTAALEADNTFPTLNNPAGLSVTYSSSKPDIAKIDANGNITLGAEGKTTITAIGAESATHKSATDTYELTVVAANCKWVETTTIEDGDEVVMIMVDNEKSISYAMYNQKVTSTNPLAKEIDTDIFSLGNVPNEIIWDIHKDENGIVFYSKTASENYLRCNAAPNVRVSTGSNNTFALDKGYIKNLYYGTYLAVATGASTKDWRHYDYSSNNVTGQTLKLYKRECLDVTKVWVEGNLTNVTCEPQLPQQLAKDGSITLTFSAVDGYTLPDNVTVTNATKTWNKSTGTLTISNPTNNVLITIEAVKLHTITWMVGSSSVSSEDVANGTGVTQTPASNPRGDAIGDCADTFLGWSEKSAGSTPQGAAYYDDLCSAADMKSKHSNVTGDKTFYAVFATEEVSNTTTTSTTTISGANNGTIDNVLSWFSSKNEGTAITAWNDDHFRLYPNKSNGKGSSITITPVSGVTISEVVLTATSTTYAKPVKYNIDDGSDISGTWSSTTMTISDINATSSFKFRNAHTGTNNDQVRVTVSVTYSKEGTTTTYSNYVTNCCATPVPTNGSYTSPSGTSVTLTWDGESTQYHITGEGLDDYSTEESYTITDLTECNEYTFYVSAYPEGGCESEAIAITAQPFSGSKTVTFNYNGNGQANTTSSTSCGNTSVTLPTPSWTGYRFMGWFNAASGGTKIGEAGASYTPTADITLFAHWEKEYNVTYNANGGSTTCAGGAYIAGETVTVCTTNPSKTGHTFTGWTYSPNVTITDGKFVMPASDVTITAQWTINQYTVTWKPNGGKWGESTDNIVETYEYGATIVQPAAPQRDGYRFTGWSPTVSATMPAGNKTYTAQWKQNYTITFHDGNDVTPWTQTKDAESINLTEYVGTLACDDYQFAGWSTDATIYDDEPANITTWVTGNYTPIANIDLYAVYTKGAVTNDFTLNCAGGVYEIWEKGTNQHMAGRLSSYKLYTTEYWDSNKTGSNGAPFTITRIAENTYTIQNADGEYITCTSTNSDDLGVETAVEITDRYKWIISTGTNGTWRFTNKAATSYALVYYNNRYFELRSASSVTAGNTTTYDLELTPAAANVYQSNPNCGPYYIKFETHGGEFIQGEYAYGEEKTGLTETTYSKFPAAELEGYTFVGWRDGNPQEDVNYEPYLKKQGEDLVVSSNKTYHAVYYYYDEEEDIDWSEEFTTGIYAEVNGMKYFLAGTPSSGTMSSTTDCGYVSEVTITPGTGANAGKYKITVNGVAMAPKANETDLLNGTYWWTITERSAGSGEYKISGQDKKNIVLRNSSWGHYAYNQGSEYGDNYYYPRFGKCLEHHWTSDPPAKPSIKLSGEVYVTATYARGIMATSTLKVSAKQLNANEKVNITSNSNDVYFSTDRTVNFIKANKPHNTLPITADANGAIDQEIYVHYKPSTEGNGTPASVVVSANLETPDPSVTDDQTIYVRNLPAEFVIATKVGAIWYALPADMREATNPLGVVIEVDETTMTTIAPNTTTYTLWPVKTTATENDRYTNATGAAYGDRVRFAAVNYEQRGLWANNNNNGSTIRNYAVIDALGDDGLAGYEWKVTTTVVDGHWQYTLQTDQDKNQNFLRYWTSAEGTPVGPKWGTYNAGENKLYFLPVTEAQPFEYAVVEWYPTKVLIQTDAAITDPTVKVGGEKVEDPDPILTSKGGKLYEISNLPLETNPNKLLQVNFTDNAINYTNTKVVPIILSRGAKTITGEPFATLTQKVYQYADVVVRDGATLTIDGGTDVANTLFGVTIYPTAKVSVPENNKLSLHNLTFFGGIDEIYNGSSYEINKYGVPQLSLKGKLNKTVTNMDYIMRVDLEQMYQVGVPYDVNLEEITYWDGTKIEVGEELYVSAYDGQKRANLESAWVWEIYWEEKVLKAGIGYTISADMQSGVGNEYSIIRLPMKSNIASGNTEAEEDKTVQVYAYANTNGVEITDNSKGWNFLSNPYMTAISGAEADSKLVVGHLDRGDVSEPWEWVDDTYRYVTIPSDDGTYHYQQKFKDAILYPFKSFFLQIATSGELSFALASRQSAPARYLQTDNKKREVEFEVLLANDTRSDNLGLLISEAYTPAYEINADLEKMIGSMSVYTIYNGYNLAYNALSPTNAEEQIPIGYVVPTVGEYTWALDESSNVEDIEHIYLYDYETSVITDLLTDVYTFTASEQKSDTRFAINVTLKSKDSTVTGLVNVNKDGKQSVKFIYNDKIYILHNGVIYDATGKFVETINK